ncbi:substrate-binding domain-containing protein [Metabacillus litoralis]|uniref:substrate-binding domain-containing protein n=1 Tax=Metabacillus litoralis TaxID=152268 RepID=UPI00203C047D|nr:substrate-binding domain-containing protein [Metabacillus litoralis]MCM3409591.1 substrate-binding domain-containing protein [Metabacillus litoralis]
MKKHILIIGLICTLLHFSYPIPLSVANIPNKNIKQENDITNGNILIGATFLGSYEFPITIRKIMLNEAKKKKIDLITKVAGSNSTQTEQIKEMINKKVDVLILNSADFEGNTEGINLAVKENIPVVVVNTLVNSNKPVSYIGSNDIEAGEISMQFIAEKLSKKGNIVILKGKAKQSSTIQRGLGINNTIKNYPEIRVLEEVSAQWSKQEAYYQMEKLYEKYGESINAVVAHNDEMALGASNFLIDKNLRNDILLIGTDGINDALKALKNGEIDATVYQDAEGQAKLALEAALVLAKGGTIAKSYFLPYKLVTEENVDYFIK